MVDVSVPEPAAGEALVRIVATGVNFIDVYFRNGLYKAPLPLRLGCEASGVVERVDGGVADLAPGDRVAYAMVRGSYAEFAVVPAAQLVKVPDEIDFTTAAGIMLQGMTADYLTRDAYPIRAGEVCLVHAAAGGTGALIVQLARQRGARVIGTASTTEKAQVARDAGAHDVIRYTEQDFEAETLRLTSGRGVDVVYDSVGRTTFDKSLGALKQRGTLVLFGQSSGPVEPFDPLRLNTKGSLYLTRPSLAHYIATRTELLARARHIFEGLRQGTLTFRLHDSLRLSDAAAAHRLLESRQTTGKVVLSVS